MSFYWFIDDCHFCTINCLIQIKNFIPDSLPLLAESHRDLPPAIVITAQFDVLRDEGEAYAEKLKLSGVAAKLYRYDGMLHDFVLVDRMYDQAHNALDKIAAELKKAFDI